MYGTLLSVNRMSSFVFLKRINMCNLVSEAGLQEQEQNQEGDLLLYIDRGIACDAVCLYCAIIRSF